MLVGSIIYLLGVIIAILLEGLLPLFDPAPEWAKVIFALFSWLAVMALIMMAMLVFMILILCIDQDEWHEKLRGFLYR
jgi:hypothetical protein